MSGSYMEMKVGDTKMTLIRFLPFQCTLQLECYIIQDLIAWCIANVLMF